MSELEIKSEQTIASEIQTEQTLNKSEGTIKAEKALERSLAWGHIQFEGTNGLIHNNCRALQFNSASEMNEWFRTNEGCFAAQVNVSGSDIVCLVEKILSDEEQTILRERGEAINEIMAEKRALREKSAQAQKDAEDKRTAELEELVELGKKCQHNHAAVINDNAKLKKELQALRKKSSK